MKHVQKTLESSKSSSKKAKGQDIDIESNESDVVETTEIDSEGNLRPSSKMPKSSSIKSHQSDNHDRQTKKKKSKEFEVKEESEKSNAAPNSIRSSKAPKSIRSSKAPKSIRSNNSSSSKAPKSNSEKDNFQDEKKKSSKSFKEKKEMMSRSKEELVRENLFLREIVNKYRDDVHEFTRMQNNDPRVLFDYIVESVLEGLESELVAH